ncbi:MAG TPA: hypothetical protein VHC98_03515 [Candidatus Saccharimonadales bacterium]|nr:hypothetical protein [Candidatus Saccharimonadales bacterium]
MEQFRAVVYAYYRDHGRHDLLWRLPGADGSFDPYTILVSEIMLQQTQVPRVIPKFTTFLQQFPTADALAAAPLGEVLVAWQGLGYNRRAKFLWQAAHMVAGQFGGVFPHTAKELMRLPGVGANTAGAVLAYAHNVPALFVETNIRTVYIHHFFQDQTAVPDAAILELVAQTIDRHNPREFYWALMDYGTYLKQTVGNLSRAGKGYATQSKFEGSLRQLRGKALRLLAAGPQREDALLEALGDVRGAAVVERLAAEGLIRRLGDGTYDLP